MPVQTAMLFFFSFLFFSFLFFSFILHKGYPDEIRFIKLISTAYFRLLLVWQKLKFNFMKRRIFLGLGFIVMLFSGLLVTQKVYAADYCVGNHGTCTLTWWCCNCNGQPGCREEVVVLEGYRPGMQ